MLMRSLQEGLHSTMKANVPYHFTLLLFTCLSVNSSVL